MRTELPTGTVTFLFTDVEGSTQLLNELGPTMRHSTTTSQTPSAAPIAAIGILPVWISRLRLVGFGDDAEAVAVRVDEDDEVVVRAVLAFVAGSTEAEQPLDLSGLISGVEV